MLKDLALLVWTRHLVSDYSVDAIPLVRSWSDPRLLAGLTTVASLVGLLLLGWRRSRPVLLGTSVFVLFLLPAANLLFPAGTLMAERLLYLPSLGICVNAGHLVADVARRGRPALVAGALLTVVLLALGAARTWSRI